MANVGDFFKVTFVQEMAGVAMQNSAIWQINDLGTDPSINSVLNQIMVAYRGAVTNICTIDWTLTCGIYENLTQTEVKAIVFSSLTGSVVGDAHPQDQVVRWNRYGLPAVGENIVRSWWNQTGIAESLSTQGRVNNSTPFADMTTFLTAQLILAGPTWTINPALFGAVIDNPVPTPNVQGFQTVNVSQFNNTFMKLRSRKTKLCNAG